MKPIDLRNATWAEVMEQIEGRRLAALNAVLEHGPGTTRQISDRSGIDILSLRPRVTELYHLGFIELIDRAGTEGIYKARSVEEAERHFAILRTTYSADPTQTELPL